MPTRKSPNTKRTAKRRKEAAKMRSSHRLLKEVGGNPNSWFEPSPDSAARWKAIPLLDGTPRHTRSRTGRVVYDSWESRPAMPLRDVADGQIRRLQFRAGKFSLEIVAERTRDHWEFVGRIYSGKEVEHSFVLRVGRLKLLAETDGFYHWSSRAVPRTIQAVSYNDNLNFGEIEW